MLNLSLVASTPLSAVVDPLATSRPPIPIVWRHLPASTAMHSAPAVVAEGSGASGRENEFKTRRWDCRVLIIKMGYFEVLISNQAKERGENCTFTTGIDSICEGDKYRENHRRRDCGIAAYLKREVAFMASDILVEASMLKSDDKLDVFLDILPWSHRRRALFLLLVETTQQLLHLKKRELQEELDIPTCLSWESMTSRLRRAFESIRSSIWFCSSTSRPRASPRLFN